MKRKLALIIPTMDRGGAEKQLALLACNLPRDEFDVKVFLLTRGGPRCNELRDGGVDYTVIGKRFKADPSALFRLRNELQQFAPDIAHTWIFAANAFGRMAARLAKVPVIIGSERCIDPWKTWWHWKIDRYLAKHSAAMTTNSAATQTFYTQHGISAELFHVIRNGIPARQPSSIDRYEAFRRLGVAPDRRLIISVGRLWAQKRYRDLVWAGELVGATRQDTTFVVIGEGPQRDELLRFRDAVTTPKHVAFVGQRNDVADLLPHADLFWNGSEYEGQSNAVIEAMQAGVPVIASDIQPNRELIRNGETGRLAPLGDRAEFARHALELLDDPDECLRLAENAKALVERDFSVSQMIDGHVALYRKLMAAPAA
ncbi:glycosyltransferase [Rhodopirellula sp. MGV]|uniref:glycosyltransferase n=1 Tax=Rhodopirellula sp. MGV TaxID=2023130 RepID=UPI000B9673E1|nr:glycosyltransferase [Rhodopirellula sp. MGV]OYP36565.1 glycosyl transferase family 1 [Rhodopirellula sp. MGV]PNY34541.1 glycosyl transferase family 1 [Rhodopirellula baltica]